MTNSDHSRNRKNDELRVVSAKEAARLLGKHPNTLVKWRMSGTGPRFVKTGRAISYVISDILDWLDQHKYESTAQYQSEKNKRAA